MVQKAKRAKEGDFEPAKKTGRSAKTTKAPVKTPAKTRPRTKTAEPKAAPKKTKATAAKPTRVPKAGRKVGTATVRQRGKIGTAKIRQKRDATSARSPGTIKKVVSARRSTAPVKRATRVKKAGTAKRG